MPVPTPALGITLGRDEHAHHLVQRLSTSGTCELSVVATVGDGQLVVLKRLPPRLATDPIHVERFRAEARLAALFDHPRIVRVHEVVESERDDYYTMEYVRGADLRQLLDVLALQRRTLPLDCAVLIAIEVCNALDYAHELVDARGVHAGIVHRELASTKVLIGDDGDIKLTGFGAPPSPRGRTLRARNDSRGYPCPERFLGEPLDARSDIFALGVMLYELTSGMKPFADASEYQIMSRIVGGNLPRPSEARRGYPRELEAILMRALERDRAQRYQTAGEMQRELETFLWSKWPTASTASLARVVRATFPGAPAPASSGSALAYGSGEHERIDLSRPGPERSEGSEPQLWLGPVPLAKPYPRMSARPTQAPPPSRTTDLAVAIADLPDLADPAELADDRPTRADTESARITARAIDLPLRAAPTQVERHETIDDVIDLIPTVAVKDTPELRARLGVPTARPRREPTALDFSIEVDVDVDPAAGRDVGHDHRAVPPPPQPEPAVAPAARASATRIPHRSSEASLGYAVELRPPSSDPHAGTTAAVPRTRRMIAFATVAVAGVALSFWAIWRNVHEAPPLPPVVRAQPAPPEDVVVRTARPTAPTTTSEHTAAAATAPVAAPSTPAATPAARAKLRPAVATKRVAAPADEDVAAPEAMLADEPVTVPVAPATSAPAPASAPRPRIKPPHAGLFPPTDLPADAPAPAAPPAPKLGAFDAVPAITSLEVQGALPEPVARRAVESALGALRACYRTAAKAHGAAPALDVQIGFEVGVTRTATKVRAIGGGQLQALTRCAATATAQIRSAQAPGTGTARVLATIHFRR